MRHFLLFLLMFIIGATPVYAATNISSTASEHFAWNDLAGWMNFYNGDSITVTSQRVTGWANTAGGELSFDCATTSIGNICGSSNYEVVNDGLGNLSGYAWNDTYGWFSMSCVNHGCATSTYATAIDPNSGVFSGYAWNDVIGWTSFNCVDIGACGVSDYKVVTSWYATSTLGFLDSAVLDTGLTSGAQPAGLFFKGTQPIGTQVIFQIATSNSGAGPWNFAGPDGTLATGYSVGPEGHVALLAATHPEGRYLRYRVVLVSDLSQRITPTVDEVILRWSP